MKLKQLEISGFKSFADKTVIDFISGMTGIVGPNGSGKSNIIEAIRWVMGAQSAKELRGDKMVDVIFGGSTNRQPLNRAEVKLTLDNSDHYLNSEFNEIQISRKLYRDGKSSFQINGIESRLKDITELFTDSGLGRESFSIISQGRVEEIFSEKPEERRSIIEEVAGVYQYKKNKEKAQSELDSTQENLNRIEDIVSEVETRVEPLFEQSKKAEEYNSLSQKRELLEKTQGIFNINKFVNLIEKNRQEIKDIQEKAKEIAQEISAANQKIIVQKQLEIEINDNQKNSQEQLLSLTQKRQELIGQNQLNDQKEIQRKKDIETLTNEINMLSDSIESSEQNKIEIQKKVSELSGELTDLDSRLQTLEVGDFQTAQEQMRNKLADLRVAYLKQNELVSELKNTSNNSANSKQQLELIIERNEQKNNELSTTIEALQKELVVQKNKLDSISNTKNELENKINTLQAEIKNNQDDFSQKRNYWYEIVGQLNDKKTQLNSFQKLDEYAAYYQGVRNIMSNRSRFPGIRGVIADLFNVEEKYVLAIETVLASTLQQVVVDTESTAKQAVKYLTSNRLGRVTFLPVDTINARKINDQILNQASAQDGFVNVASQLVKSDQKFSKIVSNLLGTTIVAESIESATNIARTIGYKNRIVTLDGQLVNAGGSITGGAFKNQNNSLLNRQNEIKKLTDEINELEATTNKYEAIVSDIQQSIKKKDEEVSSLQNHLLSTQQEILVKQSAFDAKLRDVEEYKKQINQNDEQTLSTKTELNSVSNNSNSNLEIEQQKADEIFEKISLQEQQLNELIDQRQDQSNVLIDLREKKAKYTSQVELLSEQVLGLEKQISQQKIELKSKQERLTDLSGTEQIGLDNPQKEIDDINIKIDSLNEKQQEDSLSLEEITERIQKYDEELSSFRNEQNQFLESENKKNIELTKYQTNLANIQEQLEQNFEESIEVIRDQVDLSVDIEETNNLLSEIKKKIQDLGSVNLSAIQEYEEVKTRYDFLTEQQNDLIQAKENILSAMAELDQEVQIKFKQTFDKIAASFSKIFVKMFGGGQARLALTDPEKLLTTGIDIFAQPPGKKFRQMSLLSGGEKALTAITLLFSILEIRSVPFAILDETEAALDEANVDRFASYLHNFSGQTQFIVITHRKGTMVNANVLYGVTMQESGVSKMVSVKLEEAQETVGVN